MHVCRCKICIQFGDPLPSCMNGYTKSYYIYFVSACMWVTRVLEGLTGFVLFVTAVFLGFYVATDYVRSRSVAITIAFLAFGAGKSNEKSS